MKILNLDSLKAHIDIVEIISHFIVLRRQGRNYVATCPFHNEKTGSFIVSQTKNMYYCFGCHAGGDAIKFVMDYSRVEFQDAVFQIANILNLHVEAKDGIFKDVTEEYYTCNQVFLDYIMANSNIIESYVLKRGITQEVFKEFKLGFAGESFEIIKALNSVNQLAKPNVMQDAPTPLPPSAQGEGNVMNPPSLAKGGLGGGYKHSQTTQNINVDKTHKITDSIINKTACTLGLITDTKNGYISYFYRRLIIPIFDTLGRIVGFSGRVLKDLQNSNSPKYINSKESKIYKKKHILYGFHVAKHALSQQKTNKEIYIVEGYFDVLALHSAGIKHAVGLCGTALTKEHIALLQKYECNICLSLDSDSAGKLALKRSIELLLSFEIYKACVLDFNSIYKDCNDILLHEKEKLLNPKKIPIIEYYIKAFIFEKFNSTESTQNTNTQTTLSIEKRNDILKECVAFLNTIQSGFIRDEYFIFASKLFGFNLRVDKNTHNKHSQTKHINQDANQQNTQRYHPKHSQYYKSQNTQRYHSQHSQYRYKQHKYKQDASLQIKDTSQHNIIVNNDVLELQLLKSAFRDKDRIALLNYYTTEADFFNKDAYNAIIKNEFNQQLAHIIMNDAILEYENNYFFSKDLSLFLKSKTKASLRTLKINTKKANIEIKEKDSIFWELIKDARAKLLL